MLRFALFGVLVLAGCDSGGPDYPEVGGRYQNASVTILPNSDGPRTITRTTDFVMPLVAVGDTAALLSGTRIHTTVSTQSNGELSDSLAFGGRITVTRDSVVFLLDRGLPTLVLENGVRPDHTLPEAVQRYAAARRLDGSLAWNWGGPVDPEQEEVIFERQP